MRMSMDELNQGMRNVLSGLRDKASSLMAPKKPDPGTDESRKNMLGSGTASQAAQQIMDRKKANEEALKY